MRALAAVALVLTTACTPSRDDPISSARSFIRLARAGRCGQTWPFYTKASQATLVERSKKAIRDAPYYAEQFAPHNLDCTHLYADYVPRTIHEKSHDGDTVVLGVTIRTGTIFPIPFFSDHLKDSPAELRMTREDGVWKVAVQPPPENPYRHLVEYGKFTVDWPRQGNSDNPHRMFQVSGLIDATPEQVEAVFLDFEHWPAWMPMLVESRALTPPDTARRQRIYGRYELPGAPASADYVFTLRNGMRTTDHETRGFGAGWSIEPDTLPRRAGVVRLTSWGATFSFRVDMRVTGPVGLRVQYGYSGLPGEWPPALAARIFTPEMAAEIMRSLEREARRRR